jgi:hypothetical protein
MFDFGGGLGIRNIGFLLIFLFMIKEIINNNLIFPKKFVVSYNIFLAFILPGILVSLINSISISTIISWILSFLLIPIFYIYSKSSNLKIENFITAGKYFAICIITLFFGRLFGIGIIIKFHNMILPYMQGFFTEKHYLSGSILPNVYFQGTLSLVICGTLAAYKKKYLVFSLILLVMTIAPSRFGFLILCLAWLIFQVRNNPKILLLMPLLLIIIITILSYTPFGIEFFAIFNGKSDGVSIRAEHTKSVFNVIVGNPLSLVWGSGPGSIFYSSGAPGYVSNIEISQLEFFRKYGIFAFVFFHILYFSPILFYNKTKDGFFIPVSLLMYYFVAFSNPVLFSLFSMLFLAFIYSQISSNKLFSNE